MTDLRLQLQPLLDDGSTLEEIRLELDEMIYWHRMGYVAGQKPYTRIKRTVTQ